MNLVEALHTTAGVDPVPADLSPLKELAWVFAPYQCVRRDGELDRREWDLFAGVVAEVVSRIGRHLDGCGGSYPLPAATGRWAAGAGGP